jgi:hypothetical protein
VCVCVCVCLSVCLSVLCVDLGAEFRVNTHKINIRNSHTLDDEQMRAKAKTYETLAHSELADFRVGGKELYRYWTDT